MSVSVTDTEAVYTDLVRALRDLGRILRPAVEARWEAPPGVQINGGKGVPDPTGATVSDPRRSALSDEVIRASAGMIAATALVDQRTTALDAAFRRWEGEKEATAA